MIEHDFQKNEENNFLNIINKNFNTRIENKDDANSQPENNDIFLQPKGRKRAVFIRAENSKIENYVSSSIDKNNIKIHSNYPEGNYYSEEAAIKKDGSPKTILEIINDTSSGTPMSSDLKKRKLKLKKNKTDSDNSETFSIDNSEISGKRSDKPLLRNKSNRELQDNNSNIIELNSTNYGKFFKPKLIWDPNTNKMIIEKPTIQEASLKMHEEILKNNNPIFDDKGDIIKITSSSFKKNLHTDKWKEEETSFFYKALECFGTDFSFLEIVLKPRNRAQIKNKFRKEEKENPANIETALKKYDPKKLAKMITVLKQFKEEMKIKNKRKFYSNKKNKNEKVEIKEEFDFKKLFMDNNNDGEENKDKIENFINEISENEIDEDSDQEDEVDKTVSINYEEDNENHEINEYSYLRANQVKVVKNNMQNIDANNFNDNKNKLNFSNSDKVSKVKIIIDGEKENYSNKSPKEKEAEVFCYDFLKKFQ